MKTNKKLNKSMDILASIVCRINHLFKMAEKSKRMKWLDNRHKSRIINGTKLTPDQYKLVKAFYNNYHCKIRPYGHEFYLEKTNVFDPKFIPDSIHFRIIDRFYNDWTAAHYFDNKCFYHRIFQGIQMPDIIAYRLNGYWYNNKSEIVDFNFVQEYVNDAVGGGSQVYL